MNNTQTQTIDTYIKGFPESVQETLSTIRTTISDEAPEAIEAISYGMPTFKLQGKNMIHFAAFKDHIGIYPTSSNLEAHIPEVANFRTGKGTLQFPLGLEIPLDLIRKIVKFRIKEIMSNKSNY